MTLNDELNYARFVKKKAKCFETRAVDGQDMELLHCALGLAGEAGEFVDAVKKYIVYSQPLDITNMDEECGDILFFLQLYCNLTGKTLGSLMDKNVVKLTKRYPEGYTDDNAKLRLDKQ